MKLICVNAVCDEHFGVKIQIYGLRMNMISNTINAANASRVTKFQANEQVDARTVGLQQTKKTKCNFVCFLFFIDKILPVIKIKIQFTKSTINPQMPPKTFVYQKSASIFKISVASIN